tara:strand:- start:1624 stop:2319 length:696 start_codon:yes stop_codon:yes gene_type:complete
MIRIFDFFFSLIALILFLPFFIIICVILKFTGEGKIFYLQKRVGLSGKNFSIIKFVTMLEKSDSSLTKTITVKNDPRVLPFGSFLRKFKINELPQLINVLIGDMSLIGPRPLVDKNLSYYNEEDKKLILKNRPGLSGIGSIIFSSEEDLLNASEQPWNFYIDSIAPYKSQLEKWFSNKISIRLYFELIFFTIYVIFKGNFNLLFDYYSDLPKIPEKIKEKFILIKKTTIKI